METGNHRYFLLNKPYGMVSQFTSSHHVPLLGSLDFDFPEGIHAIGRLDKDSEGLLLLTTNKKITRLLFQSKLPHQRRYLVQVKNIPEPGKLELLRKGVHLVGRSGKSYLTLPASVETTSKPANLPEGVPAIHENAKTAWLAITLTEGRFHQVRKMVAFIKHPCLRLVRTAIEGIELQDMRPGEISEIPEAEFFRKLNISDA